MPLWAEDRFDPAQALVLRDAVTMIAAGMTLALPCVAALGKLVQSQLFGVTATDPTTIAAAAMGLRRTW
jgi:hypothetical protein